ncbi:adenine nucleotide alpha hydrolases-like protein [Trichoderma sp. SZMC 28014]
MTNESLNVIALISGGKDSFFNLLHCIRHGHRIVALANLYPEENGTTGSLQDVQFIDPAQDKIPPAAEDAKTIEEDLNSFMYQTVGHEVIPLYAAATGLPLYRQPIRGGALHHERDYDYLSGEQKEAPSKVDETESMLLLLQAIKARHPEANALCSGAILSTYQRTRVESIALRLGLTPLAYLWKYPVLPPPANEAADEAQLLRDMAVAGLDARIIKVASAGLDENHLWERVSDIKGVDRVKGALRKFGAAEGATLGEGGEFETLVLDGPSWLFKKKIAIPEQGRKAVNEGGGSTWLMLRGAHLQDKPEDSDVDASPETSVRAPELLDSKFQSILDIISSTKEIDNSGKQYAGALKPRILGNNLSPGLEEDNDTLRWSVLASPSADRTCIEAEMHSVVGQIRELLSSSSLDATQITNTTIILRNMADFPRINAEYGKLFTRPNPPSRVTISCGPLLPPGYNVMAFLTVPKSGVNSHRSGLHVQSRSYWAPANIGPYSQAIDISASAKAEETGVRAIYIAGQIPLIPASMTLPPPSETGYAMQIALSLQHLWRIGLEMKVQLWSSAVAYFAKSSSPDGMKRYAKAAGLAWRLAHGSPEDDEDDESELDPWDLKHNSQYASLGNSEENARAKLPDWSIFTLRQQNEPDSCIPPFFAAEVEELPRQSIVEWHAHVGLSKIEESSAEIVYHPETASSCWRAWHTFVRTEKATLVYTTLAHVPSPDYEDRSWGDLQEELSASYASSVTALGLAPLVHHATPHLAYVEATSVTLLSSDVGDAGPSVPFATIPCHTIWSAGGERIKCVAWYKMILGQSPTD